MRVLIVGAGPSGLTTAVELARHGVMPTVIDRRKDASSLSRAVGITPRSLEILQPSGVTDRLLAEGIKIREVRIYSKKMLIASLPLHGTDQRYDHMLALPQDRTEAALRRALAIYGGAPKYGMELTGLRWETSRIVAETADGAETPYDYVIGADGIHSTTRSAAGIGFPGYDLTDNWSIADVDADNWVNARVLTLCLLSGGRVVVVAPLDAGRFRVISNTDDALATLPLPMDITAVRREGLFTISVRHAATYALNDIYLVGDAAHCHSPVGGRGMNLGIADGAELAGRMIFGNLSGYGEARRADAAETIYVSERARKFLTSTRPFNRLIVSGFLKLIMNSSSYRQKFAETLLKD